MQRKVLVIVDTVKKSLKENQEFQSGISVEHFVGQWADVGCKGARNAEMLSRDKRHIRRW